MKKFTSLLIGVSLALAGAAFAQQTEESPAAGGKKGKEKTTEQTETKAPKTRREKPAEPGASASVAPGGKKAGREKGTKAGAGANANAKASAAPSVTPATAASASAAPTVATATGQQNAQATGGIAANKPNPQQVQQAKQKVQQIKQQHANFRAQPKPDKVPAVTFTQNYRIQGSESWQGPQYEVFRSYRPERHDRNWYHSHYTRVELIGGGYYFWNNGYWYPAWGYSPSAQYYAYDGPIYVGHRAEPPDRVIADVQAELQQMGYYKGEVDGLLGPMTREALTAYQADQGLATTAAIDEPTLDSLGMS